MSVKSILAFIFVCSSILFFKLNEAADESSQNYELMAPNDLGLNYWIIGDRKISDQLLCLAQCNKECLCRVVLYSLVGKCIYYRIADNANKFITFRSALLPEFQIFKKKDSEIDTKTDGLVHYWPLFHGTNDVVGGKDITIGSKIWFICWFGYDKEFSALRLEDGYFEVPKGVNFNSSFTITAMVLLTRITSWSTLIYFGNNDKNITISLCDSNSTRPSLSVQPGGVLMASKTLKINTWTHLAFTLHNNVGSIYIDGQFNIRGNFSLLPEINYIPTRIYVGKSNQNSIGNAYVIIYGLKIFNRALAAEEINDEAIRSVS